MFNNITRLCFLYILYVALMDKFVLHANYYEMPKLYELDNYADCMERSDAVYCMISIQLYHNESKDPSSSVWNVIQEVNADEKHYFRHDIIHRGVCSSNRCNVRKDSYLDLIKKDESRLVDIFHDCLAEEFQEKYNLSSTVSIESCKYHTSGVDINRKQWSFFVIVGALITLCIVGCFVKKEDTHKGIFHTILLAFSLRENWNTLMKRSNMRRSINNNNYPASSTDTYLYGIQGVRTFVMMFVIIVHVFFFIINSDNPETLEWLFGSDTAKLFYNGHVLLQVLLCVSGFLLTYHFLKFAHKHGGIGFRQYPQLLLQRWLRFTPVNLLTISYIVLWSSRVNGDYPVLRVLRMEEETCSKHWWNNLLYINNRNYEVFQCMPHTWYLAVDMQLYCLMSFILIVVWKLKHLAKYLLGGLLVISMAVLSYTVYVNSYASVMVVTPQVMRTVFQYNIIFQQLYVQAYSNATAYVVGMVGAYLHYQMEQNKLHPHYSKWLEVASQAIVPALLCAILSGSLVFEYGGLVAALFCPLNKAVVSSGVAVFLIAVVAKTEYFQKNALESRPMLLLGSLSFSALMVHIAVQTYLSTSMEVFHISFYSITKFTVLSLFLTYLVALVVYLVVEMPFCNLEKLVFNRSHRHAKQNGTTKKIE